MAKRHSRIMNSPLLQKAAVPVLAAVLFLAVCLASASTVKFSAVLFLIAAFAGGIFCFKTLRERFTLPMVALGFFVLIGGISTFYAVAGKFALQEFLKLLISFSLAVFLLAVAPGKDITPARRIASVLERFTALAGLVSIDMISTRVLSGIVTGFLSLFSADYSPDFTGLEVGIRINSIFQNPNVFASIAGLGVILSLALVVSGETRRERTGHLICLYCNALAFLLAFSMSAVAFIAVAFVVYLLLELPARRARLFVVMVETLVLTMVSAAVISLTSFSKWDGIQPIPILCLAAGSAALWAVDSFVGYSFSSKLAERSKILVGLISGVLAAAVVFVLLAYNITGPIGMVNKDSLRRAVYPEAGEYTVSAQGSGMENVSVRVLTQNKHDTMMHTETTLYRGALSDAVFTVPEDSLVVYFVFTASGDSTLERVELIGPESVSVPLGYKLLPSFIANRLQGLFANENVIQRTVFFEDSMKIFGKSPVFGRGLGSFENGIKSVQSFFYETKYAHNHYIQTLAETGLVGLVSFILMLAVSAAAVFFDRRKKENSHPLTPALGAALVFMAGHAMTEVTFSYYAYLPMAFSIIALIALCCGGSIPMPKEIDGKVRKWSVIGYAALALVFSGFLFSNISATTALNTWDNMEKAAKTDRFEYADHMLSYVYNVVKETPDDHHIQETAAKFAEKLSKLDSNTVPVYLSAYYFTCGQVEEAVLMAEKHIRYSASDSNAWEKALEILRINARFAGTDAYDDGIRRIVAFYNEWTENNIGTITLSDDSKVFLSAYGLGKDN